MGSAGPYRWEFERGSDSLAVDVHGSLVLDDMDVSIRAAMDGIGLAFSLEEYVAPHLASGDLVRVLEDGAACRAVSAYRDQKGSAPSALSPQHVTARVPNASAWAGMLRIALPH